ncbi:MAG: histidine--tRNA ligase [Clostridia bacterium]|nr:histidine--tRNA ligase [Clostridia bacterium]
MEEIKRVEPRTLSGFMELLPQDQIKFNEMLNIIKSTYELYGFLPQETPIIESSEVLLAKAGGETEKQIYSFKKGDKDLSLRFDLTVPLAKYVAAYYNELTFPYRRYQVGKVFRGERAQKGRYREFYQCDIDIIGDGKLSIINDAEIPSIIYTIFKKLNFGPFIIKINNRKILNGLFDELNIADKMKDILIVIDKLEKIGMEAVKEELAKLEVSKENIEKIESFIKIDGTTDEKLAKLQALNFESEIFKQGLAELTEVIKYVRLFKVEEENFMIDLTIARGLDYYTGTVYETNLVGYESIGSVCSGGRYENLAGYYTKKDLPGVGISIGLTRLFYNLKELGLINTENKSISKVDIITMGVGLENAVEISNILRENNISNEIYKEDSKVKAKFSYANNLEIPYVIIIGEEEVEKNMYTLKNMITGDQKLVSKDEILKELV